MTMVHYTLWIYDGKKYIINERKKNKGIEFDPEILDIMLNLINEGKVKIEVNFSYIKLELLINISKIYYWIIIRFNVLTQIFYILICNNTDNTNKKIYCKRYDGKRFKNVLFTSRPGRVLENINVPTMYFFY